MGCVSGPRGRRRSLVGLVVPKLRAGQGGRLVVSLALGLGVAAVPGYWIATASKLPPIHDISTRSRRPPAFVAVLPARGPESNPVEYGGAAVADAQRAVTRTSNRWSSGCRRRRVRTRAARGRARRAGDRRAGPGRGPDRGNRDDAVVRLPRRHCRTHQACRRRQPHRRALAVARRSRRRRCEREAHPRVSGADCGLTRGGIGARIAVAACSGGRTLPLPV